MYPPPHTTRRNVQHGCYATCVHAGRLSCFYMMVFKKLFGSINSPGSPPPGNHKRHTIHCVTCPHWRWTEGSTPVQAVKGYLIPGKRGGRPMSWLSGAPGLARGEGLGYRSPDLGTRSHWNGSGTRLWGLEAGDPLSPPLVNRQAENITFPSYFVHGR